MTGDDFRDRYQILKRLTGGDVPTFLARARGGDRVMVHVLQAPPDVTRDLLARVARLSGGRDRRVREVTRHRGTDVLVTDFLDDFESLEAWLPELPAPGEGAEGAAAGPDGEQARGAEEAGEFTRLFQQPTAGEEPTPSGDAGTPGDREPAPEAEEGTADRREDPTPREADAAPAGDEADGGEAEAREREDEEEPGEFTRMFELGEAAPPESGTSEGGVSGAEGTGTASGGRPPTGEDGEASEEEGGSEPPEPGGPPRTGEEPGEFTRLFEARGSGEGPQDREETSPEAEEAPGDAGDRPSPPEPAPPDDRSGESAVGDDGGASPNGEAGGDQPGEFTRMFGAATSEPGTTGPGGGGDEEPRTEATPEQRPEAGSGEDAPVDGRSPGGTAQEGADDRSAGDAAREAEAGGSEPERAEDDADEGPGEFTRMFGSPDAEPDDLPASTDPRGTGPSPPSVGSDGSDDYLERLGRVGSGGPGGGSGGDAAAGPSGPSASGGGTDDDVGGGRDSEGPGRYTRMMEQPSAGGGGSASGSAEDRGSGDRSPFDPSPSPAGGGTAADVGSGGDGDGGGGSSRTIYLVALGAVVVFALGLVLIVLLVGGEGEEGTGEPDPGAEAPDSARVSTLPGEHHQQLQLGIREVGRHVDGQIPRLTDGGPVVS